MPKSNVGGIVASIVTVSLPQSLNAKFSMVVTPDGMVTNVIAVHVSNIDSGIVVKFFDIYAPCNAESLANAPISIWVTLSGIVTDDRLLHPANALCPMVVILVGIYTLASDEQL